MEEVYCAHEQVKGTLCGSVGRPQNLPDERRDEEGSYTVKPLVKGCIVGNVFDGKLAILAGSGRKGGVC